ncbi:hypothetical protein ACQCU1_16145 [Sutcliffiella horikoshii]|uniref:hypothetical protein n=1 Tax=Sutcliffiella horikoshii TaxID=79883 RepID=UPI003CF9D6E1
MWETLPNWFWIIFYLFLLATLGTAIFCLVKSKMKNLSIIAIVFALTVPIVSLINSIERAEGMNELDYLIHELQQGATWSVFVTTGYSFLIVWWIVFLFKNDTKKNEPVAN